MAKRTKLLSLLAAAVMCFACGFAMMFSANAAVEVPTVSYSDQKTDIDWSTGKNFNHVGISTGKGIATDWFVLEYYVPAGNTLAADTAITFALVEGNSWASYEQVSTKDEADGLMAKTSFAVVADSAYMANATAADVKVRLAMSLTDGKVYGSVADAAFEEIAAIENFAYIASAETKIPYIIFGGNPSIKRLNNVKLYTEEGTITDYAAKNPGNLHHGAGSFIADRTTSLNITAERPAGSNIAYLLSGSSLNLVNAKPTTSDWIVYEYTIEAGSTYANAQNGICTALSNDGWIGAEGSTSNSTRSSYLHAFASAIPPQTIGNNLFAATEDTTVKMAVNTITGLFAYYRNGAWTTYGGAYKAAGISGTDRYFSIKANGAAFNGKIKDVVCYDANGVDLGITSTMEKIVDLGLDNIDTSNVEAKNYNGSGTKTLYNATATTAKWIIFEWTNGESNDVTPGGGHMFSYGLATSKVSTELVSVTDRTQLLEQPGTTKVAFETSTGLIYRSFNGGAWTACPEGSVKSAADTGALYAGILWNNGNVVYAELFGLKCYDENGNDLGVDTNFAEMLVLPSTAVKPAVDNTYYANDSLKIATATATKAQYIIIEYTLKAGTGITAGNSAAQNAFISTISNDGSLNHVDVAGTCDGFLYQYGTVPSVYTAYDWFTADGADTAVKMVIDTKSGNIFVSKNGGAFNSYPAHTNVATISGEDRYFYISTNGGAGYNITGYVEDIVCYDSLGANLGLTTNMATFGTLADDHVALGAHGGFMRYQGNVSMVYADGSAVAGQGLGNVPALKNGTEATTVEFIHGGGALQLVYLPTDGTWGDLDGWYLIEEGTPMGGVLLSEDVIVYIAGTTFAIFKADYQFAINYAGAEAGSNPTTRTFAEAVDLAPASDAYFFEWDVASIPAYTYGDVTVTALFKSAEWIDYSLTIGTDLSFRFNVKQTGNMSLTAQFTMVYDGENAIEQTVAMKHYTNFVPGKIIGVSFTFTGILPQHLGDAISVKIMNGEDVLLETEVSVKGYLDALIASETAPAEDKAVAQDLLYYGAAAQLYTGHDVEKLPADLNGVEAVVDAQSIYAKAGDKDAKYYWTKAALVYDNTLALAFEFVAPAEGISVKATIDGVEVAGELVAIDGGYEFTIQVPASKFDAAVVLTIFDGETAVGQVLTYSVNSYIAEMYNAGLSADYMTLLERVYAYGVSAAAKAA